VTAGDEVAVLAAALSELGWSAGVEVDVLADQPGRRRVVRAGDVVVKAFSSVEIDAWRREVAGLRAVGGLGPEVVAVGPQFTATRCIAGVVPMRTDVEEVAIHEALGPALAALHRRAPVGLAPWSVTERLRARLADPPSTCPPALVRAVGALVEPLLGLAVGGGFVHGDWGTANVLVDPARPTVVLAIIDFEDAHDGDPAEDLKWQVLAGPSSDQFVALASSYVAAGGSLGGRQQHVVERLVVAGAELCLDVAGWGLPGHTERCLATLDELVGGAWPAWPAPR
jgi:hypothetical protein